MNRSAIIATIFTLSFGGYVHATQNNHHNPQGHNQNPPSQHNSNSQSEANSQAAGIGIAGAVSDSTSKSNANSTSESISSGVGVGLGGAGGNATAEGGSANSSASGGSSNSDAVSTSQGGEASSDSSAESSSDNSVSVSSVDNRRYPRIPVNAGMTFAQVCQEGISGTNAKISIAITTDSVVCGHLRMADSYQMLMKGYVEACDADYSAQLGTWKHHEFTRSQVKGSYVPSEFKYTPMPSCDKATKYEELMMAELAQAQSVMDKTHSTGIIAKWANQLGIPVTVLATLLMVL